jgi:hypothetical protein
MMVADLDETAALAWLCQHLPRLRAAAGNRTQLEEIVARVRDGDRTARWVCRQLGVGDPTTAYRSGEPSSLVHLNITSPAVTGDYVCPYDRCIRRAEPDDAGREPRCHLGMSAVPMRFRGRELEA